MGSTYLARVDLGLLPCSSPSPWAPACEIKNMLLCTLGGSREWWWDGTLANISWCFTTSPCYPLGMLTSSCSPVMRWWWWLGLSQGITESPRRIVDPDGWIPSSKCETFLGTQLWDILQYNKNNNSNSKNLLTSWYRKNFAHRCFLSFHFHFFFKPERLNYLLKGIQ